MQYCSVKTRVAILFVAFLTLVQPVSAGVPEWLRVAARLPVPDYPEDTPAVLLWQEKITEIKKRGDVKERVRMAYKILNTAGTEFGDVAVFFDQETELSYLKAWSLPAGDRAYELKEKEAVESSLFSYVLYDDTRQKRLRVPAAVAGNIIGYEYERKRRPYVLEDTFRVEHVVPVLRARYEVRLPRGWEFDGRWVNYEGVEPRLLRDNRWEWVLSDVGALELESSMPSPVALAVRLQLSFFPDDARLRGRATTTWKEIGRWYDELASGRRQATAAIRHKVADLTDGLETFEDKVAALASFVQQDVRYVAIEIGIGGFRPYPARSVLGNLYGDCKDKATLLASMLGEIGVDSYYVLINTSRGAVAPEAPSAYSFNHMILAVALPEDADVPARWYATGTADGTGRVLFFDPTDATTPMGYLPTSLQANYGLLVTEGNGSLVQLPLLPSSLNRILRAGQFVLTASGGLTGNVQEVRMGVQAFSYRQAFRSRTPEERREFLEDFLSGQLTGFTLHEASVENLERFGSNLVLRYRFSAEDYGQPLRHLMLLRPRVLGQKGEGDLAFESRVHPVEFSSATRQNDVFDITLPAGLVPDELPPPVEWWTDFADYRSSVTVEGNVLRYRRTYTIKKVWVSDVELEELQRLHEEILKDERSLVVLRRVVDPTPSPHGEPGHRGEPTSLSTSLFSVGW